MKKTCTRIYFIQNRHRQLLLKKTGIEISEFIFSFAKLFNERTIETIALHSCWRSLEKGK